MIEDKNGIYVVTPGSMLPDLSRVAKVEEVGGEWVLAGDCNHHPRFDKPKARPRWDFASLIAASATAS